MRTPFFTDCEWCGRRFRPAQDKRNVRFCSYSCARRSCLKTPGLNFDQGRWFIICRDGTKIAYARALMEVALGRELSPLEIVHHVNGDSTDDRVENLQIVTRSEHVRLHRADLVAAQRRVAA